jgi:hypothetical protein
MGSGNLAKDICGEVVISTLRTETVAILGSGESYDQFFKLIKVNPKSNRFSLAVKFPYWLMSSKTVFLEMLGFSKSTIFLNRRDV